MVVVIDASTPEEKPERKRFTTRPSDLRRLSCWLEEAVMQSTAQYWRRVWLELEPYLRWQLAQAFSNRAPRGRKHAFKDAERLVGRRIANELILSFVPDGEPRTWRNITRMKTQLRCDNGHNVRRKSPCPLQVPDQLPLPKVIDRQQAPAGHLERVSVYLRRTRARRLRK
jgi:hypothetical protein